MVQSKKQLSDKATQQRGKATPENSPTKMFEDLIASKFVTVNPAELNNEDKQGIAEFVMDGHFWEGQELWKGVPWADYTEVEIQGLLKIHFEQLDYTVTWPHRDDPAHEKGVDLRCHDRREGKTVLVAIKKKPKQEDIGQALQFSKTKGDRLIYVYVNGASQYFLDAISDFDRIELWDDSELEMQLRKTQVFFRLMVDNSPAVGAVGEINSLLHRILRSGGTASPFTSSEDKLRALWTLKDRSASAHKCATLIQSIFEEAERFSSMDHGEYLYIVRRTLDFLYNSCLFSILGVLQGGSGCLQADLKALHDADPGRSNWSSLFFYQTSLRPGEVLEALGGHEKSQGVSEEQSDVRKPPRGKHKIVVRKELPHETVSTEFRRLGIWAAGMEGTIDSLFERALSKS